VLGGDAVAVLSPSLDSRDPLCQKPVATIPALAAAVRSTSSAAWKRIGRPNSRPPSPQRVALQAQKANQAAQRKDYQAELLESQTTLREAQALDATSNAVVDLVHAGRLDEAEQAARELLVRYPEVHDGYDRLGMVHEARGQFREAADCYRKVIEFTRANPEDYDAGFVDSLLELIVKLQARATEAERAVSDIDRSG